MKNKKQKRLKRLMPQYAAHGLFTMIDVGRIIGLSNSNMHHWVHVAGELPAPTRPFGPARLYYNAEDVAAIKVMMAEINAR